MLLLTYKLQSSQHTRAGCLAQFTVLVLIEALEDKIVAQRPSLPVWYLNY